MARRLGHASAPVRRVDGLLSRSLRQPTYGSHAMADSPRNALGPPSLPGPSDEHRTGNRGDGADQHPGAVIRHEAARRERQVEALGDPDEAAEDQKQAKNGGQDAHSPIVPAQTTCGAGRPR